VTLNVVSTTERPDLVPTVAGWVWEEFWRSHGHTLEQTAEAVAATVAARDLPQTYVLLVDDWPVGTATLAARDLEERPDLTPWLAGVFVAPDWRGRGYAALLVSAVENVCLKRSIATLWLYTRTAERIYARCGWRTVETIPRKGRTYALMRRDLIGRRVTLRE
jgi:GNAT superfamily N-acetyltransferase